MFRKVVSLSIVSCIALWSYAAVADDSAPVTQGDLKKLFDRLDKLEQQIQPPKAPAVPVALTAPSLAEPAKVSAPGAEPKAVPAVAPTESSVKSPSNGNGDADLAAKVAALERRVKVLENAADNQETLNVQLAEWVNGRKGVAAIGDKPAVAPPKVGTLVIRNDMPFAQDVAVNGAALYHVEPRTEAHVQVPVGSITTQIHGEAAMTWNVGAPNYSQVIIIAPASRNPLNATNAMVMW